ncbi:MAG: LamG domain-containing protein [Verrucomicrobia bacterium]|nr:LamG domain-containing protein [Verrucomicrobiota bacterium]
MNLRVASRRVSIALLCVACASLRPSSIRADTVALWLFDEQAGVFPSSVLNDAGPNSHFLILGRGAEIGRGKFGNALRPIPPAPLAITTRGAGSDADSGGSAVTFGLRPPPAKPGRTQPPMTWENAHFAAVFTNGDSHLRRAPFANATDSKLNLGDRDWTIECWLRFAPAAQAEGVIFEIGAGPRGENDLLTRFSVLPQENAFALTFLSTAVVPAGVVAKRVEYPNPEGPPGGSATIQTATLVLGQGALPRETWVHVALVHVAGELRIFVDGKVRGAAAARISALPHGDEAYVSIGRDGRWGRPLAGEIDELRISDHAAYRAEFTPPASFARMHNGTRPTPVPVAGPPLLFGAGAPRPALVELGARRHLFLDAALVAKSENIAFSAHQARVAEPVVQGGGWISVVDAEREDIRLYANGPENGLAVFVSKDGVNFTAPDLGRGEFRGRKNIVVTDPASVGSEFIDGNGPADERWKIVTGLRQRGGIFVYTSADGFTWRRHEAAALPFWAGSAASIFYDDFFHYAQSGFIDERGAPVPGFSIDECVYANGDEIDYEVEWRARGGTRTKDVAVLAGKPVQLVARMRGASLYALQFTPR